MSDAKKVLVLVAEGSEEMEAVITIDVLRRAKLDVTVASVDESADSVTCSRGVKIVPDAKVSALPDDAIFDCIVMPGGMGGTKKFMASKEVGTLLKRQEASKRTIAAICAAPLALKEHKVGGNRPFTSHPGVKDKLEGFGDYREERVVFSEAGADHGALITSRGPGTSFEFALRIVAFLCGEEKSKKLIDPMLVHLP